ncbi:MAG: hypothetical protein GXO87_10450 [Chlorobi bacterium]|nr:hypothetical protein [Chlorobiota bacterium]
MRKINDDSIILIEETHTYRLHDDPEFKFTSCTTFVKYFFKPFDKIGVAANLTETNFKYMEMTAEELMADWDKSMQLGTKVHKEIEQFILCGKDPEEKKAVFGVDWIKGIMSGRYDFFSEVIIYSKELGLAGSIDFLLYDKENEDYKIVDWKTNKRLDKTSFNNKMGVHPASAHLPDCNFSHYSLQLSLYRYLLEKHYGLNVTGSAIAHLNEHKLEFHKTPYLQAEIEEMLNADIDQLAAQYEAGITKEL